MTTLKTKLTVLAASVLALAATAQAQMSLGSNITLSGYAAASYTKTLGTGVDRLDLDSVLVRFTGDYKPVTAVVSLYNVPGTFPDETHLLDAYVTWDASGGWTLTAGRFNSWLGYESYFTNLNVEITAANAFAAVAAYEDGVRAEYKGTDWTAGLAFVDSAFTATGAFKGDAELKNDYGVEAYLSYTGISKNKLWVGLAFDSRNGLAATASQYTIDLWDEYQVSDELTLAAEVAYFNGPANTYSWLVLANYKFDKMVSLAFRVSGDENLKSAAADNLKFTIAPTYKVTDHFSVRAEISQTNFSGVAVKDLNTVGVQAIFSF
jgi:hypothetical protein